MAKHPIKKRINITPDADITVALASVAKRDHQHITTKAAELLRFALELEEDLALTTLARTRVMNKAKYVSHESAWK